ncbi:MAG TPA: biotin--[acetyl-CoA-carboxylase] ligase [Acidimicrobiia bacterium]|nr:biotin--[acetyl-CoA-carboxylase] ligase [Acidimicrobiia bacterium]
MVTRMAPVSHNPPGRGPFGAPGGTRFGPVRHVAETGSTNADLVAGAAVASGGSVVMPDGSVLVADHQTAGRGRLDRRWDAPPAANLLFSVLLRPTWDPDRHPLVTTTLAVATVDALGTHGVRAAVKWPNDVLLVGGTAPGKVAGILAELVGVAPVAIVVGMGVNVGWPALSDDAPPGATSLAAAGHAIDRAELLESVLARFEARLTDLEAPDGPERLRLAHLERSATVGVEVRVDMPDGPVTGTAVGLALDGSLLVDSGDGPVSFRAGDVVHLRPA